ncbi:hypothetical protein CDD83_921 [Cordyceps sp. RAO-2017]|nr:hypothetical protein CDD83_921 [Cordyceps sp. RAO-2017]
MGRGGILEEQCDASGTCSQDAQTFKAIFFHHLTAFCEPVEPLAQPEHNGSRRHHPLRALHRAAHDGLVQDDHALVRAAHLKSCSGYLPWVRHNARAALDSRDEAGRFGMWWGASLFGDAVPTEANDGINHRAVNATDYRNHGTPQDAVWGPESRWVPGDGGTLASPPGRVADPDEKPLPLWGRAAADRRRDPNDRGRGRTVETQAGGVALLRAYWELSRWARTE